MTALAVRREAGTGRKPKEPVLATCSLWFRIQFEFTSLVAFKFCEAEKSQGQDICPRVRFERSPASRSGLACGC